MKPVPGGFADRAVTLPLSPLPAGEVVSWAAVSFAGEAPFAAFAARLPVALQNAVPRRRNEFLAGRYCAVRALARAGCMDAAWPARRDDGLPAWPAGWLGSISHTADGALAAVARCSACTALGVDVERIMSANQVEAVRSLVAMPGELERLTGLTPAQALTLLFSAKEALYKALYPQLRRFVDFSAACVSGWQDHALSLRLAQHWSPDWPQGRCLPVAHAFVGPHVHTAVCVPA